ncbi:hypothetical protein CFC21_008229 [Triticum aestivum]|uniref:rRNA N-glycosylase n=3 Tax=Triticum TaxID=4564 RepID=A0A9R0R3G5_TRITD|nr:uncharacterized protein LOC123096252 [Triticum aestivum]KAF6991112.1 hypothetical protein CFC21_008229 [Triticum aestivum]VAH21191.1 unnamed protein product [Triticum turgidum subsp. durum]
MSPVAGTNGGAFGGAKTKAVFVAIVVLFARTAQGEEIAWEHDVLTQEHTELLDTWHNHVIETVEEGFRMKVGDLCDVMAPQREPEDKETVPPATWIKPTLKGRGNDKVTLWFANDNLYFLASNNLTNQLHTSKGYDAIFVEPFYPLSFGPSYKDLMGVHKGPDGKNIPSHKFLVDVPLGKESLLDAIHVLSSYDSSSTSIPVGDLKIAMAQIILMGPESLRFRPVRDAYILQWGRGEIYLTEEVTDYLVKWSEISKVLVWWEWAGRRDFWVPKEAGELADELDIESPEEALGLVDLLLRPEPRRIR